MGLAASQARFLGITARKSNIEYEGQQVNQQRTALAQEVNALYSRLTALQVPVAPSPEDYYTTNYTFTLDQQSDEYYGDYLISNYYKHPDGKYHVEGTRSYTGKGAIGSRIDKTTINIDESGNYIYTPYGTEVPITLELLTDEDKATDYKNYLEEAGAYSTLDGKADKEQIIEQDKLYYYKDSDGNTFYFSQYQMDNRNNVNMSYYAISGNVPKTETFTWDDVDIALDTNGRIKSVTKQGAFSETAVDAKRTANTEQYDAALRDYTMSKDEYNKAIEDINAKTKALQQEDKVLELRLNQIDTEQKELSTELDAVKEVLKKNVENTFKTFA